MAYRTVGHAVGVGGVTVVRGGINDVREGLGEEGEKNTGKVEEVVNLAWRRILGDVSAAFISLECR